MTRRALAGAAALALRLVVDGGAAAMSAERDAVVAARLAPVQGRSTLRITTRGRRTGKPHTVPIWFIVEGATIYLGTLDARRDWVRNLERTAAVELEVNGLRLRGRGRAVSDPALDAHARTLLARKYWLAWIGSWFGRGPERMFRIDDLEVTT